MIMMCTIYIWCCSGILIYESFVKCEWFCWLGVMKWARGVTLLVLHLGMTHHESFLERFFKPHPTHLWMTVPDEGSGLIANLTPRKSLMSLNASIPYGESFPTRIFETSCGHRAQRTLALSCFFLKQSLLGSRGCEKLLTNASHSYHL